MNTIPLTFDQDYVERTVVGGTISTCSDGTALPVTVILLNHGGRCYRSSVFDNLLTIGFESIVSIESNGAPLDLESLSAHFPSIKFIMPQRKITVGEMINIGIAEAKTPYCFVIWNDILLSKNVLNRRMFERLQSGTAVCTAPILQNQRLEVIPSLMVPVLDRNSLRVERMMCCRENSPTIYAVDYIGLYNRDKFIALEGFDSHITDPYWQNLDFGFRAHLWGMPVKISTMFRVAYENEIPAESIESNDSYTRFFLKNIAVAKTEKREAEIPLSRLPGYLILSGKNLLDGLRSFFAIRAWVHRYRAHFKSGGAELIRKWALPQGPVTE